MVMINRVSAELTQQQVDDAFAINTVRETFKKKRYSC